VVTGESVALANEFKQLKNYACVKLERGCVRCTNRRFTA